MSQPYVERVVGLLVTDEALRKRFAEEPLETLRELAEGGMRLTECEQVALASIDPIQLASFADAIDPRLQKADLKRSAS